MLGKAMRPVMVAVLLVTLLVSIHGPVAVHAAGPYVVTSIADDDDADTSDGQCKTSLNVCTLRAAIQQANADNLSTNTTISFMIPGAGVHTIVTTHATDALPVVLVPITIDGTTQPGWAPATANTPATLEIEINCGSSGIGFNCLQLRGATSTVKGLTINHADVAIIVGNSVSPNPPTTVTSAVITGNHLGTNPAGTAPSPNQTSGAGTNQRGILIGNGTVTIGGTNPADRNVITGFGNYGILTDPTAGLVTIQGNYIGTNAAGTAAISPFWPPDGVQFATGVIIQSAATIGGPTAAARNIISGWPNLGMIVGSGHFGGPPLSLGVTIQNNYIGTDVTGTAGVRNITGIGVVDANNVLITGNVISANLGAGIDTYNSAAAHATAKGNIIGSQKDGVTAIPTAIQQYGILVEKGNVQVGGTTAGDGNIIAFNNDPTGNFGIPGIPGSVGGAGIAVNAGSSGTTVLGNSIFSNGQSAPGSGDGITLQSGANNNQAAPTLTGALTASGTTTIIGTFNSAASTTYRVEFFANTTTDAPGISEGETFLGSLPVTTDGSGSASINTTAFLVPAGKYVTATATDTAAGNTSQFSNAVLVSSINQQPTFTKGPDQTVNENAPAQTVNPWATAISAGAGDTGQTVTFQVTNNTTPTLFSAGPAVDSTGVLTYTPATNQFGSATITLVLKDNGGTANGGVDTSDPQTFTITVNNVNQQPTFTKGPDQTVLEDAGPQTVNPWATAISAGSNEGSQTLTFQVTNNTNAALFAAGPAVDSTTGVLTYTPAANANGTATITLVLKDNGGTANGGVDTSTAQTFVINVTAVNDVPSFTKGPDQTVNENAGAQTVNPWATAISAGPNEGSQTLTFQVTNNTNVALFAAGPAVDSTTGTLTYTPAANVSGIATITLVLKDNGGTATGGVDTSPAQTFTITVNSVNQVPSFTKGPDQTVNENAGAQTINPWATAISAGAGDTGQTLTFQVTNNTNAALFSAGPAVDAAGTLTYTPAANVSGSATITLVLKDNGGTANGGVDTSPAQTFVINVTAVNQQPSFTKGPDQAVLVNAGAQTVNPWATAISAGAGDTGQTLTFIVTNNTNTALFSAGPAVDSSGVLTYTPAANATGSATITLVLKDNGGTANGGVDTSPPQTFVISVAAVNHQPTFTKGPDQTVLEDAGPQTVNPWATAISIGAGDSGQTVTFIVTNNTNAALFSAGPAVDPSGVLTYTPAANANGTATITLVLKDNGGTANGGVDTSAAQTFVINVTAVNDVPSFTKGPDQTVAVNAGAQTVTPWATAISAGPPDEAGQTLTFQVTNNTNPALFAVAPAVSPTGALTYTPAANATGSATVTLVLKDNGGTANGGVDTSPAQTFTITVSAANHQPTFTKGPDQAVPVNAGAQTVPNWATAISAGAGDTGQTLTFIVTNNTNAALFSTGPAVDAAGTLTYTPAANATGSATITLVLKDNGGTANGGVDTSPPQTFTITVSTSAVVANADSYTTAVNAVLIVAAPGVLANDIGTPAPVAVNAANATNGTVTLHADGSFTFTPTAGFVGTASFTYAAMNSAGTSPPATVTITVTAASLSSLAVSAPAGLGSPATIKVGQQAQLTATATLSDGTTPVVTNQAQWSSDNGNVVKVDPTTGKVTGQGPGTAMVTATYTLNGVTKTATIAITVTAGTSIGVAPVPAPAGRPVGASAPSGGATPVPVPSGR